MIATQRVSHLEVYPTIGKRIRSVRQQVGLRQEDLAIAVDLTRCSINNIEQGRQRLGIQLLYDIAEVLGVPAKDLLP